MHSFVDICYHHCTSKMVKKVESIFPISWYFSIKTFHFPLPTIKEKIRLLNDFLPIKCLRIALHTALVRKRDLYTSPNSSYVPCLILLCWVIVCETKHPFFATKWWPLSWSTLSAGELSYFRLLYHRSYTIYITNVMIKAVI